MQSRCAENGVCSTKNHNNNNNNNALTSALAPVLPIASMLGVTPRSRYLNGNVRNHWKFDFPKKMEIYLDANPSMETTTRIGSRILKNNIFKKLRAKNRWASLNSYVSAEIVDETLKNVMCSLLSGALNARRSMLPRRRGACREEKGWKGGHRMEETDRGAKIWLRWRGSISVILFRKISSFHVNFIISNKISETP